LHHTQQQQQQRVYMQPQCFSYAMCTGPQSLHQLNPSRASFGAAATLEIGSNYDVLFFMLNWQSATDLRYSLYGMRNFIVGGENAHIIEGNKNICSKH
jgi:hypothetical protein